MRASDAKLAAALRAIGLEEMAQRAERSYYNDFFSELDTPILQLLNDLTELRTPKADALAERVKNGEFDADKEESDEWSESAEGQNAMGELFEETPKHSLGDAPIEPKLREVMNKLAALLDNALQSSTKEQWGFVLLVFPFDTHEGRCNFVSNAKREDVVTLLREQLRRFEGVQEVAGHA